MSAKLARVNSEEQVKGQGLVEFELRSPRDGKMANTLQHAEFAKLYSPLGARYPGLARNPTSFRAVVTLMFRIKPSRVAFVGE